MELEHIAKTASDLEAELRRVAASVAVYEIDEMKAKLGELADVAGTIAEKASAEAVDSLDAIADALDTEVTN